MVGKAWAGRRERTDLPNLGRLKTSRAQKACRYALAAVSSNVMLNGPTGELPPAPPRSTKAAPVAHDHHHVHV